MKKIEAKIVADSISPQGHRITTMLLTFPRFILAELNTHRMFSRNSASSRAIPFEKMVKMVEEDPFIPIAWQKDHKGMQGNEYFTDKDTYQIVSGKDRDRNYLREIKTDWLHGVYKSVSVAKNLNAMGVTKQLCNRLLEPFMWHTVLVTATEWENFFELRCPKYEYYLESYGEEPEIREYFRSRKDMITEWGDVYVKDLNQTRPRREVKDFEDIHWYDCNYSQAEIHIQALAESMWDAMNESKPKELKAGEWHIPFGDTFDEKELMKGVPDHEFYLSDLIEKELAVATARCARLSYMTFDGKIDYNKDIKLHDILLEDRHLSPFEHCARAMTDLEYDAFAKLTPAKNEKMGMHGHLELYKDIDYGWCNNFKGWIQYRYLIENENVN